MDPSLSFLKHFNYVTDRIDKRQEKQYANGTVGIVMGTGQGDVTVNLQRIGEIYRMIWCTSLDSSPGVHHAES